MGGWVMLRRKCNVHDKMFLRFFKANKFGTIDNILSFCKSAKWLTENRRLRVYRHVPTQREIIALAKGYRCVTVKMNNSPTIIFSPFLSNDEIKALMKEHNIKVKGGE